MKSDMQSTLEKNYIMISPSNTEDDMIKSGNEEEEILSNKPLSNKIYASAEESDNNMKARSKAGSVASTGLKKNPRLIYSKYKKTTKQSLNDSNYSNGTKMTTTKNKYDLEYQKIFDENTELKKQLYQLRGDNINLQEENSVLRLEKEKISKIKENEIALLNEKIVTLEQQNKKLAAINETNSKKIEEYSPKVWKYDELNEKYKKISKDNEELFNNNSTLNTIISDMKKTVTDKNSKNETLIVENESLKQDKLYLTKTNMINEDKIHSQADKIKTLEEEIKEIRKLNQSYIEKLTSKTLSMDDSYKTKINSEITQIKSKYEKDIQELKKQYDDIIEKKTSYLQEERDEYKEKCDKYEKVIKEKEDSINLVHGELRNFHTKSNEELSHLKLQLSIKIEELNTRNSQLEESNALKALLKNENDAIKEKNDLIRSELIKKESEMRNEISEYKAQNAILQEKIMSYENIENELDKAICENPKENTEITNIIKDIPTSSKRRISQCLQLANKVKLLTIENEKLKDSNEKMVNTLTVMQDQIVIFKNVAEKVKQPYAYLIKNLQDRELEIYNLKAENEKKDQTINRLTKENELYEEKVNNLGNDLKTVVSNRQKLDELENVITSFIQNENCNSLNYNSGTLLNNSNTNYANAGNSLYSTQQMNVMQPERDTSSMMMNTNSSSTKIPSWYLKLQASKKQ